MKSKYLAIDRILPKENLINSGSRLSIALKSKISRNRKISQAEIEKIDQFGIDILNENVFRLVSVRTPIQDFTPVKFNMIFDYENLDNIENVKIAIEHILHLNNNYLTQLPLGHHCEVFANCLEGKPKLFNKLPINNYDNIKIGICNESDYYEIKNEIDNYRKSKS